MCAKLSGVYGDSLEKIVLYGSYARGEQTEESDVDVALVLREKETEAQYNLKVDLVVDYELEHDVVLSTITIEIAHFEEWRRVLPFYKNIEKDGITLWQAV
ncbi:MAG: nucleotidyltransferase domain-containing protein [Lachnospiraceae bacterium]|nr:nucleotidyltransferase domain-containing protein [Lachnospiraceae bacterium]